MRKITKLIVVIIFLYIIVCGSEVILKKVVFPLKYKDVIERYSKEYNVDPALVIAVIKAESNFDGNAKSKKDALGLMQITRSTGTWIAEQIGVVDFDTELLLDEEINIRFGCWYLNNLFEEFEDEDLVLAAYNGGRGNVQNWLKDPKHSNDGENLQYIPFKETDKYVKKVKVYKKIYQSLYKDEFLK